jgi:hypothetical protein
VNGGRLASARVDAVGLFAVPVTLGFGKRNGQWTIVHEYHSAPIAS